MPKVILNGESPEYRRHRQALLEAEIALKDQRERVAQLRRQLPMGPVVTTDYVFREGPADLREQDPGAFVDTRLSQLFAQGHDRLLVYHMMYEPDEEQACPMCSMWVDGFNAVAPHVTDRVSFAVIAKAELAKIRAWAGAAGGPTCACCRATTRPSIGTATSKGRTGSCPPSASSAGRGWVRSTTSTPPRPRSSTVTTAAWICTPRCGTCSISCRKAGATGCPSTSLRETARLRAPTKEDSR